MLNGRNGIMVTQDNADELAQAMYKVLFKIDSNIISQEIEKTNSIYTIENMTKGFISSLMQ